MSTRKQIKMLDRFCRRFGLPRPHSFAIRSMYSSSNDPAAIQQPPFRTACQYCGALIPSRGMCPNDVKCPLNESKY